jgi:hypothetical protein
VERVFVLREVVCEEHPAYTNSIQAHGEHLVQSTGRASCSVSRWYLCHQHCMHTMLAKSTFAPFTWFTVTLTKSQSRACSTHYTTLHNTASHYTTYTTSPHTYHVCEVYVCSVHVVHCDTREVAEWRLLHEHLGSVTVDAAAPAVTAVESGTAAVEARWVSMCVYI